MSSTPSTVGGFDMELAGDPDLGGFDGGNFRVLDPPRHFTSGDHLVFNGTDQYGTVAGLLDTPPAAGCVALWWKLPTDASASTTILSKASSYSGSDITNGLQLGFTNSGKTLSFKLYKATVTYEAQLELGGPWDSELWHHCVISWGSKVKLWVDGEKVAETALTGAWTAGSSAPFCVGAKYLGAASQFCEVAVDEIEVRDVEPTLEEILTWFNRGGLPQLFEHNRWERSPSNPVISPTLVAEQGATFEPVPVRISAGVWRGVYTGGNADARIFGMAATDGKDWEKTEVIVMGGGEGGHAGDACRPGILNDNGDLYMYFTDEIPTMGGSIHYATTDDDGVTWEEQGVVVAPDAVRTGYANTSVVKVDDTYHWLIEHVRASEGQAYFIAYFTSDSPTGPLTLVDDVVVNLSLRQGPGSISSRLSYFDGKFHLYMHAGRYANLPTAGYHAVAEVPEPGEGGPRFDVRGGFDPILSMDDFAILSRQDQVADIKLYDMPDSGEVGLLYDIDDNHGGGYAARICVASFEGSLSDLA